MCNYDRCFRQGLLSVVLVSITATGVRAASLEGAATLIRPEPSTLSTTNIRIDLVSTTNTYVITIYTDITNITAISVFGTNLTAVGEIPVLATNITYTMTVTNPLYFTADGDALVITNIGYSPIGCQSIDVTNVDAGGITNPITIGWQCVAPSNYTTLVFTTNSLPNIEYYTTATTNWFFDPSDSRCWQTIYYTNIGFTTIFATNIVTLPLRSFTNLNVTTTITSNTTVRDCNLSFVGSENAHGNVFLQQKGAMQSFSVVGRDLLTDPQAPPLALGVFIGDSICSQNWQQAGIMTKAGTNNLYRLELVSANGAPPTLGVSNVSDLVDKLVQIRDQITNVYAQAVIPRLTNSPAALSFRRKSPLYRPSQSPPSPKASGSVRVKYNGQTGASFLEVTFRHLAAGNTYCVLYTDSPHPCSDGMTLINGRGFDRYDTSKGDDLPRGGGDFVATVEDLAGLHVFIVDAFGNIHLSGTIPGP
jgi:hypothetical protein